MNLPSSWTIQRAVAATLLACCALVPMLASRPTRAQILNQFLPSTVYGVGTEPDVTVTSRLRPGYEPVDVHVGTFTIRPLVTESLGYESNVLGLTHPRGSTLQQADASIDAVSATSHGSVNTGVSVSDNRYLDLPSQSFTNWNARLGGAYDFGRDTASILVTHDNLSQTQRDLDVPQLDAPLAYVIDTVRVGYRATFNRLSFQPSVATARYSYNSGFTGSAVYDQSYRNRVSVTPGLVTAYEFATRRSAVLIVRNTTAFFSRATAGIPKRNFSDTSVLAGIDYDLNGILRARALVGYETRSFSSTAYATIDAPVAELSLIYNPTPLTTVTGTITRQVQDSAAETTAGITTLTGTLRVDHELRRNILLTATAAISRDEYTVGGNQTLYSSNLGATYVLNRYAGVGATYDFSTRTGSTTALNLNGFSAASNYTDHRLLLQLKLSL